MTRVTVLDIRVERRYATPGNTTLRLPDRRVHVLSCDHEVEYIAGKPLPGEEVDCVRCDPAYDPFTGITEDGGLTGHGVKSELARQRQERLEHKAGGYR